MNEELLSLPSLFFKKPSVLRKKKRQIILDLVSESIDGLTLRELAAAVDSPTNCVSVMIHNINKELVEQGWKIGFTDLERQPGRRGAPRRRYWLVRLQSTELACLARASS
jgi:hypothetical protein